MYKQCRTEQSASRQRILEQGLLKEMSQRHYDEISVSDLCARLEIPRKSFYRYFSSKDGALHALIDHALMDFQGFPTPAKGMDEAEGLRDMEMVFSYWRNHSQLLDALERSGLSGVLIERAINHALQEDVIPSRYLPDSERVIQEQVTSFAVCGLMSMVVRWHHEGFVQSVQEMGRISVRLVSQPLFPTIAPERG